MTLDFKQNTAKTFLSGTVAAAALAVAALAVSPSHAAGQGGQGQMQGQKGGGQGQGDIRGEGGGGTSIEGRIFRRPGERVIIILEDEDSDRPPWAGGNVGENPHAQQGGGSAGSDTRRGDVYGDLVEIWRDPLTGEPILVSWSDEDGDGINETWVVDPENGFVQPLDENGDPVPLDEEGEVYEAYADALVEVDFGRASVARAPDRVVEQALDEALSKLTADNVISITTDTAGRISYTYETDVDGDGVLDQVTATIDSPLENLALYIDLAMGLASDTETTTTETILGAYDLATLETAASLLAGVADKTGDITLDYLVYENVIAGVVDSGEYYDYSTFSYTRDYPTDYSYWVSINGADPVSMTLDINDYLAAVNGELPDAGASLFAAAADDALEVIELVHTQIYTQILPGTVTP